MDDEYVDFPVKIFIDSNVALECLPLKDLPWSEIDPVGPILILVTPTFLREVDSKKGDGRLGVRAREFNRLIAPIAEHGQPITIVSGIPRVDIAIARCQRIDWGSYDDLDSSQGDERIIAEVLNVKGVPKEQRRVVGIDIYPLNIAQRHGLKTHRVSDSWLPRLGPSPQEKEIEKLKKQLKEFEKTEPQFNIKLEMQTMPVEVLQIQELTEGEIAMLIREIVAANPKPEQKQDLLSFMQQDSSLDDRYVKYERKTVPNFVKDYHKKLELLFGQIPFSLTVENTGKVRADHINIDIQIVGGWFNAKPIFASLRPPAPKARSPLFHPPFLHSVTPRRVVCRHEIEINEPRRSGHFSAQCEDFRQGQEWKFSGVVWLDPHQEREVVFIVKITAANLHGEISTPFKLSKSVLTSRACDLLDLKSGKVMKDFYVKPLIEDAIKANKYDAFEWDSASDED